MRKSLVLTLASVVVVLLAIFESYGQKTTGIAFYDVDKLHDTIPSIFYDDLDYTPSGKLTLSRQGGAGGIRGRFNGDDNCGAVWCGE